MTSLHLCCFFLIHQDNGLKRTDVLDRAFIQFSCAANETNTDNFFSERLLKTITQKNVPVVNVFENIAEDVYLERRPLLSMDGLSQHATICLNQANNRMYEMI